MNILRKIINYKKKKIIFHKKNNTIFSNLKKKSFFKSRLPIEGGEVRLLNDDEVLGTIKNPEDVLHYI